MMTLSGCGLTPNPQLNFSSTTRLVMDITIGHTTLSSTTRLVMDITLGHTTLQTMESTRRRKYSQHYQRHGLAFAPMVKNTLGQFGQELLQFLWNLSNHHAPVASI
jgi:hypothetical protein